MCKNVTKYSLKKKLLSVVPKKVNFGPGSGDAGFAMWRISDSINGLLAQILPALMPQCNECPLNSMEHATTEHTVNSYLLLVIQLNGEKIKLWFSLIQTTLYAIMLSCTHHTLPNWSALSLVCLFVCPCFPVPSCGCYRCCLRISLLALQLLMRSSEPRTGTPSPGAGLTPTGEDSALKPQCTLPDTC